MTLVLYSADIRPHAHSGACITAHRDPIASKYRAVGTQCAAIWCLHTALYYKYILP